MICKSDLKALGYVSRETLEILLKDILSTALSERLLI